MSRSPLISLFAYKAWANTELFDRLASQPPEAAEGVQGCIRTLNHIFVVDRIFRAHLSGAPRPFDATNTPVLPTLEALRMDVVETDAWYQAYVAGLDAAALVEPLHFVFTDGERGCMTREEMLLHVSTHGAYHRGNVGQMLKSMGSGPPRDLLTKFLHQSEPERRLPATLNR